MKDEEPIAKRIKQDKQTLLVQLKKTPIVQIACEKTGIGRSTYYRWKADEDFAKLADEAIAEGVSLINDMAESQLLAAIRDRNTSAIFYWLNHRHPSYSNKLEITAQIDDKSLTPEQQKLIQTAMERASIIIQGGTDDKSIIE
jgi:ACT domain-containing protein